MASTTKHEVASKDARIADLVSLCNHITISGTIIVCLFNQDDMLGAKNVEISDLVSLICNHVTISGTITCTSFPLIRKIK